MCEFWREREREREKERKKVREREREQQQHGRRQSLDLLLLEPEREFEGGVGGRRGTGGRPHRRRSRASQPKIFCVTIENRLAGQADDDDLPVFSF
jgi:hypothetical protein